MLFNTVDFIVFFAFVISLIVVTRNRNFNYILLIVASYFFFYFSNNFLITLLIFSTILDYFVGKHIWLTDDKKKKKKILLLSIIGNLGLLGFFKYTDFAISQFNEVANVFGISQVPFLEIILPVGISFYTFQTLS